ncbi:pumilio homolog 3-like [Haliotis cracherodii]|uniref:pumilio homolog 3-like n=1 Tax=Haliotis cracherodii TaxID=6455 RepID=UPI0039EABCD3
MNDYTDMMDTPVLRRKMKKPTTPKAGRSMRGNPEGNSIIFKDKVKLSTAHPSLDDSGLSTLRKRKKKQTEEDIYAEIEEKHMMRRSQSANFSNASSSSLEEMTPDTLSQISSIMAVPDVTINSTLSRFKKPRTGRGDVTWESAVNHARGAPDGAERSFHAKKISKVSIIEEVPSPAVKTDSPTKENKPIKPEKPVERKKSIKVQLKNAANRLKSLKSKGKLDTSRESRKRKLDISLPDESTIAMKKPKEKDMSWKERRQQRKMTKNNYDLIIKAKKLWEDMRRHALPDDQRQKLCQEVFNMVRGKVHEMSMAHDTARVVQCLVQYGNPEHRTAVMEEIKDDIVSMCKSKYAKFVIRKILKYGSKQQRNFMFKTFHGNVRKLIRHREAVEILEFAYNEYANAPQRLSMMEEFYGPSFTLFKNHDTKSLEQIMLEQPDKKDMILSNMKEALLPLIDKDILAHSMVHKIFHDFFHYATDKMRSEMIECLREQLITMIHTRDGSRVAMYCIWFGTVKDRKVILKSLKTHISRISQDEYGHMVLLAIFDVVDDTKFVSKVILEEMLKSLSLVAENQYGRKVLLYLLSPRDPLHFHPDIVHILQRGDANTTSKKDGHTRHRELLGFVSKPLLQYIVDNAANLAINNAALLLILGIITHAKGDPSDAMTAIANIAAQPFSASKGENQHMVEHPAGHLTLKRLILNDKERSTEDESAVLFSNILLSALAEGTLKSWAACNRGCFTLISLLELDDIEVTTQVRQQLSGIKKSLRKMTFKGAQILLQKLEGMSSPPRPQMIDL